jgi:hypothetical protein
MLVRLLPIVTRVRLLHQMNAHCQMVVSDIRRPLLSPVSRYGADLSRKKSCIEFLTSKG